MNTDLKLLLRLLEYYYYHLKDFFTANIDYHKVDFMLRIERKTFRVAHLLIKYFTFSPKSNKHKMIIELIELQEDLISITNNSISRYKLFRFHKAYNHILQQKAISGEIIEPLIISSCFNVFNAIYENENIVLDCNYLDYNELGDLLKTERSKCYQALKPEVKEKEPKESKKSKNSKN